MWNDESSDDEADRSEYYANVVRLMNCAPGNLHHAEGDKVVVLSISKGDNIENLTFPIRDAKTFVTKMLVALATYDDSSAKSLLDGFFSVDPDGNYAWPRTWEGE